MPDPFPPDHDDDDGGAARRGADRGRLWRGRRGPAIAGIGCGRRSDVLSVGHAVFDAGVLHLYGSDAGVGWTEQEEKAGARDRGDPVAGLAHLIRAPNYIVREVTLMVLPSRSPVTVARRWLVFLEAFSAAIAS